MASVTKYLPLSGCIILLLLIIQFNAMRKTFMVIATIPLGVIGVVIGLIGFQSYFGFMAFLGVISLAGIVINNAIVLIDQIDLEIREGKDHFHAVVDSGVSRMRPVMLAAATTMLGMIPLFMDAFFISMAVTIVFGLGFASVLTLVFVPTLYATFFKIKAE